MALALTLAGVDRSTYLGRGSLDVQRQLSRHATCSFILNVVDGSGYIPTQDMSVTVTDGGITWFAGLIDKVEVVLQPGTASAFEYKVSCLDWNSICDHRLVFQQYVSPIERDMILDIVASSLSGEGITTSDVDGFALIPQTLTYQGKTVTEVFNEISTLTGDQWYIDFAKNLHFRAIAAAALFSGYTIATDNGFYQPGLAVTRARGNYRNVQYVRSDAVLITTSRDELFTAGAGQNAFITKFPVQTAPTVKVNGAAQTVLQQGVDANSGSGWYWIAGGYGVFNFATPPSAGSTVEVIYNSFSTNVVSAQDANQINQRAIASGGSGRYEEIEEVKSADQADANALAAGLLRKFGTAGYPVTVTFSNNYPPPDPGMLLTVNLPAFGIATANYVVQSVKSKSLSGVDLGHGVSFQSTVTLISGEDQQMSAAQYFSTLVGRTKQGLPAAPAANPTTSGGSSAGNAPGSWFREIPKGLLNGSNQVFSLTYTPTPPESLILLVNGVVQNPYADYTLGGAASNVITFTSSTLQSTDQIVALYLRGATAGSQLSPARTFGASTDKVDWGNSSAFHLLADLSIGVWVNLPTNAAGIILGFGQVGATQATNTNYMLIVKGISGAWNIRYFHENGTSVVTTLDFSTKIPNATWKYIGITRDSVAKTVTLYMGDGATVKKIQTQSYANNSDGGTDTGNHLMVGNQTGGSGSVGDIPLVGTVEEHALWSRALSQSEHQDAMKGNFSPTNLVLECVMGNSPEVDLSATAASGTVTGTTLGAGH